MLTARDTPTYLAGWRLPSGNISSSCSQGISQIKPSSRDTQNIALKLVGEKNSFNLKLQF